MEFRRVCLEADNGVSATYEVDICEPFQGTMETFCKDFNLDASETKFYLRDLQIHPSDPIWMIYGNVRVATHVPEPPSRAIVKTDKDGRKVLVSTKGSRVPKWAAFRALVRAFPYSNYRYYYRSPETSKWLLLRSQLQSGLVPSKSILIVPLSPDERKFRLPIVKASSSCLRS